MRLGVAISMAVSTAALTLAACACGTAGRSADAAGNGFPTTIQNCGHGVVINHKPKRVVALGPSEVTTLVAAGGASLLVARNDAGAKSDPYPPDIRSAVAQVPQFGKGGGELTRENLIALRPDLVVGSVSENLTPESLRAVGIPMLALRGNCGSNHAPGIREGTADFNNIFRDIEVLGDLFGRHDQATAAIADLRRRINSVKPIPDRTVITAAAVITSRNKLEVYGKQSMSHTQFRALGINDVFEDVDSRVFNASIEEVISRNPDIVVILSYGEPDQHAKDEFVRIPGVANLAAARSDRIFVQPYEYSSQGVLSVNGLENLANIARNINTENPSLK